MQTGARALAGAEGVGSRQRRQRCMTVPGQGRGVSDARIQEIETAVPCAPGERRQQDFGQRMALYSHST